MLTIENRYGFGTSYEPDYEENDVADDHPAKEAIRAQIEALRDHKERTAERVDSAVESLEKLLEHADLLGQQFLEGLVDTAEGIKNETKKDEPFIIGSVPIERKEKKGGTIYDRVRDFLMSRNNNPATTNEICEALGLSKGSLSMVLNKTHETFFNSLPANNSRKLKVWKLSEAGVIEAASRTASR